MRIPLRTPLSTLKLARAKVPVYAVDSKRRVSEWTLADIRHYYECGRIAHFVRRADKAITRVYLKALKGQIAPRSHRTATVIHDLPMNYSHNMRACEAYGHSAA